MSLEHTFKLFEFNVYNDRRVNLDSDDETNVKPKKDNSKFSKPRNIEMNSR